MNKVRLISLSLLILLLLQPSAIVFGQASNIDTGRLSEGIVRVEHNSDRSGAVKVTIKKGNVKYTYDLKSSGDFPLQLGNGEYEVSVLENISGNKYRVAQRENVKLELKDSMVVYLQPVQMINWNNSMNAVKKAKQLTAGLKNDNEKVAAVYNYVVNTLSYDYDKINKLSSDYIPSVEAVYKSSKGICYDYSVLFAAMLRSIGIPAKLVMGYKNDIETYHAWNQVYLKDSGKWVTIDTTYDSILKDSKKTVKMEKDPSQYKIEKQY